jgi:biotin synthesis protein BioG
MKKQWLARSGTADLVLIFGGWALGPAPFQQLSSDHDQLFIDDYTRLDDPLHETSDYDRVTLVSFSFGVVSAAHWMNDLNLRPTRLVAIGGTLFPADSHRGIAPEVVRATADNLTDANFAKFCRRAGLGMPVPILDVTQARAELNAVIARGPAPELSFDRIWIPQRDRIIPTSAQEAAWQDQASVVRRVDAPHVPFQKGQNWAEWYS